MLGFKTILWDYSAYCIPMIEIVQYSDDESTVFQIPEFVEPYHFW